MSTSQNLMEISEASIEEKYSEAMEMLRVSGNPRKPPNPNAPPESALGGVSARPRPV